MVNFSFINIIVGIVLIVFIFFNKNSLGKNLHAKIAIIGVITIFTLSALAEYIIINYGTTRYNIFTFGVLLLSHLTGCFLLLFVLAITNRLQYLKKIIVITLGVTILRLIVLYAFIDEFLIKVDVSGIKNLILPNYRVHEILANTDNFIMSAYNLIMIIVAYKILKETPLIVILKPNKVLYYKWGEIVLIFSIITYTIVFINTIFLSLDRGNFEYIQVIEKILQSIFFIFLSTSMMYFPVFAYSGKHEDLLSLYKVNKEKYRNSTLTNSYALFKEVDSLIKKEKLYLDSDLKMDKVSKILSKPIPYISQAINEHTQKSFPEYINSFRIEEAKRKLLMDNPDTIFAIVIDIGFNNKTTFYNAFKKHTNMTPSQFRRQFKKDKGQ